MFLNAHIRLKDILKDQGMSQQQLAILTDLRPSTISDLCKPNVSRIYLSTIAVICTALNITVGDLIVLEPSDPCQSLSHVRIPTCAPVQQHSL
ncbi:helix-turn-helix domain-containing protein [Paenibacillus whitsoniae]|uniref:XRE family transcriptional regulator n=1 Tax=Paenibacillus whitsoniae TaxID=2496558 RepID=A0A3S0CEZ5_9BACL|nr:helix-turn-helix transcriptional regulator [Paenibacillus whitsoniae]RTE11195.1 XRE family transcriptional regulator [Paenibacillus whitsoniae]